MKEIKTRETERDIKTLDKFGVLSERLKGSLVQIKEKTEQSIPTDENSSNEYAVDHTEQIADRIKDKSIYELNKQGQKGIDEAKQNIIQMWEKLKRVKNHDTTEMQYQSSAALNLQTDQVRSPVYHSVNSVRINKNEKIKTADNTIKTANRIAEATVKTTQRAAEKAAEAAMQKTVQTTVKNSQRATQITQRTAQATERATRIIKTTAKAAVAALKTVIAGTKEFISAIAAGGWIAVVIIVVVCVIALILGSCFGNFFSGEGSATDQTLKSTIQEINTEYQSRLDNTKAAYTYDVLDISGSQADWKEVLAVYAVIVTTDPSDPYEVLTVTDEKKQQLEAVFWEMNKISAWTETKTETVIDTTDDGQGNIINIPMIVTRTYLHITVSNKTTEEMAEIYGFDSNQREQLSELLSDEYNSVWNAVIYGDINHDG